MLILVEYCLCLYLCHTLGLVLKFCVNKQYASFHSGCVFCRDTCRLIIRKAQYAPVNTGAGQKAELCKSFMLSDKPLLLEASLDKEVQSNANYAVVMGRCNCVVL